MDQLRGKQRHQLLHYLAEKITCFKTKLLGKWQFFLLIICIVLIYRSLLSTHALTTDDLAFHVARTGQYYLALKQGQLPPRWAPNLNGGFGYPTFLFSYTFPYFVATILFMVLNISLQQAINLTILGSIIFGGLGIAVFSSMYSDKKHIQILSVFMYVFHPYMLLLVYRRGAFGEIVLAGILPWILVLLHLIYKHHSSKSLVALLSVTIALAWLSHPVLSFMIFLPGLLFMMLFLRKKKAIFNIFIGVALGTLLSLWGTAPGFIEKRFIDYKAQGVIGGYDREFISFPTGLMNLSLNQPGYSTKSLISIGGTTILLFVFTSYLIIKHKNNLPQSKPILLLVGYMIVLTALTFPISSFVWKLIPFLHYLQFPWRFILILSLSSSILFLLVHAYLSKPGLMLIFAIIVLNSIQYARPWGYFSASDHEWFEYHGTASSFDELRPIWSIPYTPHQVEEKVIMRSQSHPLFIDHADGTSSFHGVGSYEIKKWNGSEMQYVVTNEQPATVIQKTYFYPGWTVFVNDRIVKIQYQDREFPGRIVFDVPEGISRVRARFSETPERSIFNVISLISAGALLVFIILPRK